MLLNFFHNGSVGCGIDAEGLFAQQVLPGPDGLDIDLLVQMMGHGAIDRLHMRVR